MDPRACPTSADVLVLRYRPLARQLAGRYVRSAEHRDDLEQVACVGLVKAARRFDPSRGTAFSTFAVPTILGELRHYCRDTRWATGVPRRMQEQVQAVLRVEGGLEAATRRRPTAAEVAAELGCGEAEVVAARLAAASLAPVPLDSACHGFAAEDSGYEAVERRALLEPAIAQLPGRTRLALQLRIEGGLTAAEIGHRLNISTPQAGRLVRSALRRLRRTLGAAP